ncbi:hypothetical protein GOP47_0018728 [Adiantum capillus-veneris]|uniref:Uncharacterized protein n=1 Tax=Adiantum capillus-veneris TaxID=13818 RepID=A0A9D4UF10_ADICA|nr:hypothetical protein GOP47_0018728 [Adiantum capillus-veneris]
MADHCGSTDECSAEPTLSTPYVFAVETERSSDSYQQEEVFEGADAFHSIVDSNQRAGKKRLRTHPT